MPREKISRLRPDVLTLDLEMPGIDSLTFLGRLMRHSPMPVVVVSSATPERSEAALRALVLGAIELISKPASASSVPTAAAQLVRAVRAAALARMRREEPLPLLGIPVARNEPAGPASSVCELFAIGAATGGPMAIEALVTRFPRNAPATVIVQHMPAGFTKAFADRLNGLSAVEVREARDGDIVHRGLALVAPGDRHAVVQRTNGDLVVRLKDGPPVHHQRPSVDVLLHSVARTCGADAIGVILTGMGVDGAEGLLAMRDAGAHTIAEDERTCMVFGMPREAILVGAAVEILPLSRIRAAILHAVPRISGPTIAVSE